MKTRFTQFVLGVWFILITGHRVWSQQSSLYFDRLNFLGACQAVPGIKQGIDFASVRPLVIGPIVTISNVTFTGRSLGTKAITSGISLLNFDSGIPLGIHFANGARAFGADFSSDLPPQFTTFTATLSLDNGETFQFTAPVEPNSTFFGFISPTPIMDIIFSDGGIFHPEPSITFHEEMIANIYMVAVPEPAGIVLAGLGAALFLGWQFVRARR